MTESHDEPLARRDTEAPEPPPSSREQPPEAIVHQIIEAVSYFQGSLPPSEILEQYERIVPGLADRLAKLLESEAAHRQKTQTSVVQGGLRLRSRGQVFAFIIAMTGLIGGIYLVATDHTGWGIGVILSGLAPIVGAFLYTYVGNRPSQNQGELHEQQDETDSQ